MVFKEQYVFGTGFEKMLIKKFIHCQDCCKAICIIYRVWKGPDFEINFSYTGNCINVKICTGYSTDLDRVLILIMDKSRISRLL